MACSCPPPPGTAPARRPCRRPPTTGPGSPSPCPSKEFLLGDIPALTLDHATGAVGLAQGVTADHADEIFMPLAPGLLIAVGPPDGARLIPDDEVDQYNQRQAHAAHDYLIHRPGANFTANITAWRK